MSELPYQDFWRTISTVSGTFTGFTLASYSLYISRTERAAADPMCRQCCFKERTSSYSLFFMLFALMMFMSPLLLGIVSLSQLVLIRPHYFWLLPLCAVVALTLIIITIKKLSQYTSQVALYYQTSLQKNFEVLSRLEKITMANAGQTPSEKSQGKQMQKLQDRIRIASSQVLKNRKQQRRTIRFLRILHVISLAILIVNMIYIFVALVYPQNLYLTSFWVGLHPVQTSVWSLFMGMILICCYFYLLQPERFLFEVEEGTCNPPLFRAADN